MKKIDYICNHPIYNNEFWDNILKDQVIGLLNSEINKYSNSKLENECLRLNNEIAQAHKEFKENHNNFIMFLLIIGAFFGFLLLIFPGILAIKKYNKLNKKKKEYLNQIQDKSLNKALFVNNFIEGINFNMITNQLFSLLKFNKFKPLSIEFINEINYLKYTNFPVIQEWNSFNSGNTAWTIFNNNIVIRKNNIHHKIISKKYVGTKIVSTTKRVNGNNVWKSETVYSYYQHPYPVFTNDSKYLLYVENCDDLEFSYVNYSNKKIPKKHQNITLENELFYYRYIYKWNDDVKIRMFFTPFFMEEYLRVNKGKEPPLQMQLNKKSNFVFTNQKILPFSLNLENLLDARMINLKLEDITQHIIRRMLIFTKDHFNQISYSTFFPIIQSESHLYKLDNIKKQEQINKNTFSKENAIFLTHYFLNEYFFGSFTFEITKSFHNVMDINEIKMNKSSIVFASLKTLTYNVIKRSVIQYEYSHLLSSTVPVTIYYDDYIPQDHYHDLFYFKFNNHELYFMKNGKIHNLSLEVKEIIDKFQINNNDLIELVVNNNFLICLFKKNYDYDNNAFENNILSFKELYNQIYDLLNN